MSFHISFFGKAFFTAREIAPMRLFSSMSVQMYLQRTGPSETGGTDLTYIRAYVKMSLEVVLKMS